MKKVVAIIIAAFAIIVIGFIVLIRIYVTPERIRGYLIPYTEQTLNRKVNIGEVKISLLKGIDVKDFAIKEKDGESDFLKCRDFVLKFQLLPLLSKKIVIDELNLLSPEVKVRRDDKGKFNFEDIGKKEKEAEERDQPAEKGLPVNLLVNSIQIKDLRFSLVDDLKKLPEIKGSLSAKAGIKSSDGSKISSDGSLNLILDEVILKEKRIKNINASLLFATILDMESDHVKIDKADLKIQGIPVSISGDIRNFKKEADIDVSISIPKTGLADLQKELASFMDLKGLSLSGDLSADIKLTGLLKKFDTLKADGLVSLERTGIKFNNINTVLDGKLQFREQKAVLDIKGSSGKNTADIKGTVANFFNKPDIKLNLYSKELYLDEVIPVKAAKGPAVADEKKPGSVITTKEAEPKNLKLSAEGEIKIDSATYKGMKMSDFYTRYQLKENKFQIVKMTAIAGKGKFNVDSSIDLSKPGYVYSLSGSLDSLHADEFVNSFFPKAKDAVFGVLSANLKLNGMGTLPESIRKNLVGNGDFKITDGKITNAKISENLAMLLNIDELRTINLKRADGTIKVKNGIARLDSIFHSDDITMDLSGNIGLDETLDLAFDLKLSPRLSKKTVGSGVAKYIRDEEGWGMIPLMVSGTFANPSYSVDIGKAGKRVIKKEVDKFIDNLFKKDTEEKPADDKAPEKKKPVEDLLKGIFR